MLSVLCVTASLVLVSGHLSWPPVSPACAVNQTMMPPFNPEQVFEVFGFEGSQIPRDLTQWLPKLLHEESVLHVINYRKKFKLVNQGLTAKLYEGQLTANGQKVLVKVLNNPNFEAIWAEATLSIYLQDHPHIPRVYGLLPYGPSMDDLALVMEYVDNCSALADLISGDVPLTSCQWVDIAYQTASALSYIHQKFVLYNDMHEKNLLVQWQESQPYVYITDFGEASFRVGESFSDTPTMDRQKSNFLGPEVWHDISTPASDVYSLGDIFLMFAKQVKNKEFFDLSERCHSELASDRPNIKLVLNELKVMFESSCPQEAALTDSTQTFKTKEPVNHCQENGENKPCLKSPLPIIPWENLKRLKWLNSWKTVTDGIFYATAFYSTTTSQLLVKCPTREPLKITRREALINYMFNDTKHVLAFYGVTSPSYALNDLCIVQENDVDAKTLKDFINKSDLKMKLDTALEITKSVATFHSRGVIINNIEPENIQLTNEKIVKFLDLDKCVMVKDDDVDYDVMDNEYVAPESKLQMKVSYASDVYSLGVVLRDVFGDSAEQSIKELIASCLNVVPANRPTVQAILQTLSTVHLS